MLRGASWAFEWNGNEDDAIIPALRAFVRAPQPERWVGSGPTMTTIRGGAILSLVVLTTACANPLNQATSDRYSQTCVEAERNGQLTVAEQACNRALVNVDWGNLGEIQRSEKMWNLAMIKRRLQKIDEAEQLIKEALAIEEKQTPVSNERIGRRAAALAIIYGEQERFSDGLPYVERLIPLADTYQGSEKRSIARIFYVYSQELPKQTAQDLTDKLATKAVEMGFDPKTYACTGSPGEVKPKGTESSDPGAMFRLAARYEDGRGVPRDMAKAIALYREAAEQGCAPAQTYLGVIYDKGRGVPPDDAEAIKWYRLAADNGEAQSQFNLGVFLVTGRGTAKNEKEGWDWIRRAAQGGHEGARAALKRAPK